MRSRDQSRLGGVCRGLFVVAAIGCALAVGACGKRGALQQPHVTTGVDEDGNKIRKPVPEQDTTKPFILDALLF